ncbi:hypothetical protein [Nocardioides sp. 503]|uniref:hypothetical protein n=1 Tax=Nocardioides sp. 503 TaxID=2508326 RepID=UPI001430DC21|nr:hypothetical protein [Nocardioides sp. 503]
MRRRSAGVVVVLVLLALIGTLLALGISATLGIRSETKQVPVEHAAVAPARPSAPAPRLTSVDAPHDLRTRTAVAELRDAVADAAGTRGTRGTATLVVEHGDGPDDDETYRVTGTPSALRVTASSRTGAVRGVYDLALDVREGRSPADRIGTRVASRLPFRMADLGAAGVLPDPETWRRGTDYSHRSGAFEDVILPGAPYVDTAAMARAAASVEEYVEHVLAEGYTAIAVPGFLEYLTFSEVPGVYDDADEHVARAEAMRAAFGPVWRHARDLGLDVYLRTDMLALSTPLADYFERELGGLDTEDPALWDVYRAGLEELYAAMPSLSGVVVRIGEAGRVYDLPGWDYYSELGVTTVPAVRRMLTAFTDQAEAAGKEVVFRTWSVGVGAVGDMHTDQASYDEVLAGLDSPALVVSTKYTLGDFYSHLPLNDTLTHGEQRRIVELQSRREFEAFGSLPNDLGDLYRTALTTFLDANPHVEGIWTWTQDGGPWRAGPMSLELTSGFWQLYELNTVLAARLARDPGTDVSQVTADWVRRWFTDDPAAVVAVAGAMARSREAVTRGLYIGPYAEQRVFALGLEPPPMMWLFEWDILTGDSGVLDIVYAVSRDRFDEAVSEGDEAVAVATRMRDAVAAVPDTSFKDPVLRDRLRATLDYQVDLFTVLGAYRTMVLTHARWLDTGAGRDDWADARDRFEAAAAAHETRYAGDLDLPAFNLTAARIGTERAARDLPMAWLARAGLLLVLGWLVLGATGRVRAARATWLAGTRPWRAVEAVRDLTGRDRALVAAVPLLALVSSRLVLTWAAAPAHLLVTGLAWTVLLLGLALALRGRDPWPVVAALGGAVLLRVVLLLAALAPRGPGGYWFWFWTDPTRRTAYVVVASMAFGWVLVAATWALRVSLGRRRAAAAVLATVGAALGASGALVGAIGLEEALTTWNDQMALLPWGLSRILGITVYLGIPTALPWWVAGLGGSLLLVGLATGRRRPAVTAPGAP